MTALINKYVFSNLALPQLLQTFAFRLRHFNAHIYLVKPEDKEATLTEQ